MGMGVVEVPDLHWLEAKVWDFSLCCSEVRLASGCSTLGFLGLRGDACRSSACGTHIDMTLIGNTS